MDCSSRKMALLYFIGELTRCLSMRANLHRLTRVPSLLVHRPLRSLIKDAISLESNASALLLLDLATIGANESWNPGWDNLTSQLLHRFTRELPRNYVSIANHNTLAMLPHLASSNKQQRSQRVSLCSPPPQSEIELEFACNAQSKHAHSPD